MFDFSRAARVIFFTSLCCSIAIADTPARSSSSDVPGQAPIADIEILRQEPLSEQTRIQTPKISPLDAYENSLPASEPFRLPTTNAAQGEIPAKWADLQLRIKNDEKLVANCRQHEGECSAAARRFLSILELGHNREGRAVLGWINRAVNLSIRPMSDWSQYGYADFWASPLQTLRSGAGDCEDYAILKYTALRALGIRPDDLRLLIVHDKIALGEHAVLAVRIEQTWLLLDNRTMSMINAEEITQYQPLFAMTDQGVRAFITTLAHR
jgi:predicted transglutaminase-like cysteine proteinase